MTPRYNLSAEDYLSAIKWLCSEDTGNSSEAIVGYLLGVSTNDNHPWDTSDFGRCYRLLDACPFLAEHFSDMSTASETWERFVPAWDELTEEYRKMLALPEQSYEKKRANSDFYDHLSDIIND